MGAEVRIYDTTLRDGCQAAGLSLSLADKLKVARLLDDFGVDYVEGGWPASNPKDAQFFEALRAEPLRRARASAFGSTRRDRTEARRRHEPARAARGRDAGRRDRREGVGASRCEAVLRTTREENLAMVADSVAPPEGRGPRGHPRRRALLRRPPRRPRPCARRARRGGHRGRGLPRALRHERRDAARRARRGRRGGRRGVRRRSSACTRTTTAASRSPTRWRRWGRAPATSRGRSTATASASATPTSAR